MDFSVLELSDEDAAFLGRARRFLAVNVTEDMLQREHETGDGFIEELHLAMGAEGWLEREAKSAKHADSPRFSDGSGTSRGDARSCRWRPGAEP